jgi:D-arabinose 1-dehydrogenase-like Zn-dependent alcohol dehydrogenase
MKEPTKAKTYRAVQVSKPGRLEVVERELTAPPPGKVRIRVEACGICHTDTFTVEGLFPGVSYPSVPGHEVVGTIDALGEGVSAWKVGQRVGVDFLGGHCGRCRSCRRGDFVNCQNQAMSGLTQDGGYAEVMIADERGAQLRQAHRSSRRRIKAVSQTTQREPSRSSTWERSRSSTST